MQVWRSGLIAGHGGTTALLCGVPTITGHGEAHRSAQQHHGDLVTLFQLHKPNEKLRRNTATPRWHGGQNAAALVIVFRVGETTNRGNVLTQANTYPNQAQTPTIGKKAHAI